MLNKKVNSIEIILDPTFLWQILQQNVPSLMPLLDSEQATQNLLNRAEIPMIICNSYNSIPASHLDFSIIRFEFA